MTRRLGVVPLFIVDLLQERQREGDVFRRLKTMSTEDTRTFFAVQLHPQETPATVARLILRTAHDERLLFWTLEVLDVIEIGYSSFLRVRTDMASHAIVDRLLARGRTVIATNDDGVYVLRKPDGRSGNIPMIAMHRVPKPGQQQAYRGTRQWEAHFAS